VCSNRQRLETKNVEIQNAKIPTKSGIRHTYLPDAAAADITKAIAEIKRMQAIWGHIQNRYRSWSSTN